MWRVLLLGLVASASAQIPSLGWCPEYLPMEQFDINKFLGTWYENVRYFTVSEIGSRCVTTRYEKTPEGRVMVFNEITNSLTGLKRGVDGLLTMAGRESDGFFTIKYSSLPVPYENTFTVLSTDYESYALMWSCSGIGPVHTQNAWILTRERIPSSEVMQRANAAVDKFKISRAFFVKTNQADCTVLPSPIAESEYKSDLIEAKHAGIISDVADLVKKEKFPVTGHSPVNPKPLGLKTVDEPEVPLNAEPSPSEPKDVVKNVAVEPKESPVVELDSDDNKSHEEQPTEPIATLRAEKEKQQINTE